MRCAFCKRELIETKKDEERRNSEGDLIIKNVPVLFCGHCNEFYYYYDKVLDAIFRSVLFIIGGLY